MGRKIGEIFEYNGEWYQCVESSGCALCAFNETDCNDIDTGSCEVNRRSDGKSVVFRKLEKVGEPYEFYGHIFQSYHTFEVPIFTENYATVREFGNNSKISIEIKQNKEDMEEKKFCEEISKANEVNMIFKIASKYINGGITYDEFGEAMRNWVNGSEKDEHILKEFDLEAAKAGKSVCTRDGRKARIICFDRDWDMHIVALVSDPLGESVHYYLSNGKVDFDKQNDEDLMMLPEKKEGWVNLYRDEESKRVYCGEFIFSEREKAEKHYECNDTKVATVPVNWEE